MAKKPAAPAHPVNAALEAAVRANAEADAPRLVYADWLDENGDPDRAAFIRTQVALWDKHPADADYVDLLERQEELDLLGVRERLKPRLPRELAFNGDNPDSFARGFPFFAGESRAPGSAAVLRERARRLRDQLPALFRDTTVRGLRCSSWSWGYGSELDVIFSAPEIAGLEALWVGDRALGNEHVVSAVQSILNSGARNLQWLGLTDVSCNVAELLAGVTGGPPLRRFQGSFFYCSEEHMEKLFASAWFCGLHRIEVSSEDWADEWMVRALTHLAELHTLETTFGTEALAVLPELGPFRTLGRLRLGATLRDGGETALARARMPRLSVLELERCELGDREVATLARSPLFANLRVLVLDDPIGDGGISAIAESTAAKQLRNLNLQDSGGDGTFGQRWFRRLATSFPNLTTLRVGPRQGSLPSRNVTRFCAEVSSPLRSLSLPFALSDEAATALANNGALTQLRTLNMGGASGDQPLTHKGLQSLLGARHLVHLAHLSVGGVELQKVIPLLRDPSVLPGLRELRLGVSARVGNKIEHPRPGLTVRCLAGS
jgi:uncharacterized protein (TIGR02996 family)